MNKWLRPIVPAALVYWLVTLFLNSYLAINPLSHQSALYSLTGALLVLSLAIAWWPRHWPWFAGGMALVFIGWLWGMQPLGHPLSLGWAAAFGEAFSRAVGNFLTVGGINVPHIVSLVLVMLLIVFLSFVVVVFDHYLVAVAIIFAYLSAVHVFNGNNVVNEFAQLAAITFLFAAWYHGGSWLSIGLTAVLGLVLAAGAWWLVTTTGVNDQVADATLGLRTALNERGFYQAISDYAQQNARTGFSENDATLGGPVYDDPSTVMTVRETGPHYLRVEVKTAYSGTGWRANVRRPSQAELIHATQGPLAITARHDTLGLARKSTSMTITNKSAEPFLALPYGNLTLSGLRPGSMSRTWYNTATARLFSMRGQFKKATLAVTNRDPSAQALRQAAAPNSTALRQELQLPQRLPQRVQNLATRLTRNAPTQYDKVKAIQNYLQTSRQLAYSKVDTPVTPRGRDYVDYFLFTSHIGYCDNFSTAMVVMLRSIGIPARWAKGFNAGTRTGRSHGQDIYTIANANAHSWPEVYFTGYGWLPFEATPGFANAAEPQANRQQVAASASSTSSQSAVSSSSSSAASNSSAASSSSARSAASSSSSRRRSQSGRQSRQQIPWGLVLTIGIGVLIAVLIGLAPLYPVLLAAAISAGLTASNFAPRYRLLLHLLKQVTRRDPAETLASYAKRVDGLLGSGQAFQTLTVSYERVVYGGQVGAVPLTFWQQLVQAWRHSRFSRWHRQRKVQGKKADG